MKKIGILTYHYSNNFGGVLQSYALYQYLKSKDIDVEIINYIPKNYKNHKILYSTGLRQSIMNPKEYKNLIVIIKRILIKLRFNKEIIKKFDDFRKTNMKFSNAVNEKSIIHILKNYRKIIVGSDQIWHPVQRDKKEYFLGFDKHYRGKKIAYAADSTTSLIEEKVISKLKNELSDFDAISVRNNHSNIFVRKIIEKNSSIVVDPTILWDFDTLGQGKIKNIINSDKYILVYVLGKEIEGSNKKAIERIKQIYVDLKVYSVVIPTMKFNFSNYADRVFYDLGPEEWIDIIRNAVFIFTDSYHGTLFALKYHKPFLAYYTEKLRATRFIDIAERYKIDRFIINNINQIEEKKNLKELPDFNQIDKLIKSQVEVSVKFLNTTLNSQERNKTVNML